jgi:hypothetical protein
MPLVKLPQPYALRMEMIRAKGYADHEVLALIELYDAERVKDKVDAEVNWDGFLAYARENADNLKAAVLEGYQFSFITIGGIKSLLSIRFHKTEEQDYVSGGSSIDRLTLSAAEFERLRGLVPQHWKMTVTRPEQGKDAVEIRIELAEGQSVV